ncbi:phage/plasmid primase, P4 family [Streptomyces sp. NPDC086554]|uniref:phage/plasmid primase, P4 family n=1 Tax=Streptomyces sp. NPDC086554 TaxID=3154864 RepID=UPI0034389C77
MDFVSLLDRFKDVSEEPDGGYLALCPSHPDSRPSLRIWRGDDLKVRLTCRAGCDTGHVVNAAGLRWADLFNASGEGATVAKEKPQLVSGAPVTRLRMYVDETSALIGSYRDEYPTAQVARDYLSARFGVDGETAAGLGIGVDAGPETDGRISESFPYRSPSFRRFPRLTVPLVGFDGVVRGLQGRDLSGKCPGRWLSLSNPNGQRWAPYGVFRSDAGYGVILITEGPGDALTAVSVGYDAVAVRGASLVNNPELVAELAAGLKGSQVIVAGDNDTAGNGFTLRLSEGLAAHGIDVHTLDIPHDGDDLTDWRSRDRDTFPAHLHAAVKSARPVKDRATAEKEHRRAEVAHRTGAVQISSDQGSEAARILGELVTTYGESDAMNAHALVAWTDGRIKYASGLGYFVWDGSTWVKSATRVRQEIHAMGAALVLAGCLPEARGFTMTSRIDALMTELRSVPSVHVEAEEFDAKPHLLSFRNGVVDLRTGQLRAHDKRDMLTVTLPLEFDAHAPAPRWEQFMSEIFPSAPDLVTYLQRLVGYGITGSTSEQCFAVFWGKGANGKSVFTDTLTEVFGGITKTTPFATFEDKGNGGGIPNDIAALRGSRLVMASEGESGKPMSEAVLKRITGKDKVTARFLRQEFFTFAPTFLIMLATNHKPKFRGQDEGLWRRVKLIPFVRYFAPEERDYNLDRKLLAERAGIVAWAVRGAVEWYANGLKDPDSITTATREYRATSDALAGFFPGIVATASDDVMLPGADAYNAYRDWCEAEGLKSTEVWSRKAFYGAMEERGIGKKKTNKGIALVGVTLDSLDAATGPGIFSQD